MIAEHILVFIVTGGLAYGGWRFSLKRWPYARCRRCADRRAGTNPGSSAKRWGKCRKCGGSGRRLRWGARERDKRG